MPLATGALSSSGALRRRCRARPCATGTRGTLPDVVADRSSRPRVRYDAASLVEVAAEVFTRRGYDGTSMEDLARAAGVTKSSIYHHVVGKEHLLRVALERAIDPLFGVLDEPEATTGPAVDRLRHVLRREVEVLVEQLPYVTLLLRVRGNTEVETWALQRRREFDARVGALARSAAAEGDLRADLDPALATRLAFGTINSLAEWYRPPADEAEGRVDQGALADAVVAFVMAGWSATS